MAKLKSKKSSKDDTLKKGQRRKDSSVTRASRARSTSASASANRTKSYTPTGRARADSLVSIPNSHSTSLASSYQIPIDITPSSNELEHLEQEVGSPRATNKRSVSILSEDNNHSHNDSNGILSSIFNVAHNAANMIGSSIDNNKPPKTHESTIDETDEKNTSFSHKLDFLLKPATFGKNTSSSSISKKSKSSKSDSQTELDNPRDSEEVPNNVATSLSNVHFDTVRESPINTLGVGDLKLDDFEEAHQSRKMATPSQSSENLIPQEVKRNPSSEAVNRPIPLSNKLTISGNNENKKVRRKSISNGTSLERVKSPESKKKSTDNEDSDDYTSDAGSVGNGSANSEEDLNEMLDTSEIKPASEKRNKEFHQIFKRIPPNEKLIDEFGCALSKDILVHGRLYLSEHYVCFNSNILGWVTNIIIPLQEVIQIEKKSTAVLFPNGIIIRTLYHKYVFATFLSRDSTFALITNVWHGVLLGDSGEMNSITDKKRYDKVDSSESMANYEDSIANGLRTKNGGDNDDDDDDNSSIMVSQNEATSLDNFLANRTDGDDIKVVNSHSTGNGINNNNTGQTDGNKSTDSFYGLPVIGPLTHPPTDIDYSKGSDEIFISEDIIKAPLGVIYLILFGPDSSNFITILKNQKNYDINEEEITELSTSIKERNYTYTKPLNGPIGPKKTKCIIQDKLIEFDTNKYILVEQITTTPDVPSGNSFQIKTKIFLSWAENNSTKIYSLTVVEWSGRSWIKGAVEKGSIDGQKESMKSMIDSINLLIKSGGAGGATKSDKKKRKRKKSGTAYKPDNETPPEPEKTILEKLQIFIEAVGKSISIPYLSDLVWGIIILSIGLLFFLEGYNYLFHHRSNDPFNASNLQILSQDSVMSKIKINTDKYFVIPSVESYFQNKQSKLENEAAIWKWVNDRTNGSLNVSSQETLENNVQRYSNQEIKEIVRIVQLRLDEIKSRMDYEHI